MIASNDTLSKLANVMTQMRASLLYAAKQGVAIADVMKSTETWLECRRAKCFFSQEF